MPTATKLGGTFTCNEELPSIKSHEPLTMWPCDFDFLNTIGRFRTQTSNSSRTSFFVK